MLINIKDENTAKIVFFKGKCPLSNTYAFAADTNNIIITFTTV